MTNGERSDRRLTGYCAAAAASLALASTASGGVVYTDVDPDQSFGPGSTITVDLNGDAIADWGVQGYWSSSFAQTQYGLLGTALGRLTGNDELRALAAGYAIGPGATSWGSGSVGWDLWQSYAGPWVGTSHQYVGVRFPIGGNTHYGWIEMSGSARGDLITIHGYAYESVADTPISAGDAGRPIPEPGSLALLALGGAGILAWRRRRKAGKTNEEKA